MIKKTKRLHQLYQDWLKIKKMEPQQMSKEFLSQPLAGKWYYTYSNDKGMAVGLAKLQDTSYMGWKYGGKNPRKWMWETCTANEGLELCRFPTQKQAEIAIYKFLNK